MYACALECMCTPIHSQKSKHSFVEWDLSFILYMGSRDWTQVTLLGQQGQLATALGWSKATLSEIEVLFPNKQHQREEEGEENSQ